MGSEEKEQYTNSPPEKVSTLSLDSAPTAEKVPPNHVLLYGTTAFVSLGALLFGKTLATTVRSNIQDVFESN
jgi:hypothetical protein